MALAMLVPLWNTYLRVLPSCFLQNSVKWTKTIEVMHSILQLCYLVCAAFCEEVLQDMEEMRVFNASLTALPMEFENHDE